MKLKIISILFFCVTISSGQDRINAEKLVAEGIAFHDQRDYKSAIEKYDEALKLDRYNLFALAEKALTLFYSGDYEKCAEVSKFALDKYGNSDDSNLKNVYVNYANSLDQLGKKDQALKIYDKGIKEFPDYYQLYYNKGITLVSNPKTLEEALVCFQEAIRKNPNHASSHNALARMLLSQNKRIPSLLVFCRFLSIEPQSQRAKENLAFLNSSISKNVTKNDDNSINISINENLLPDKRKDIENDFSTSDMILSMDTALDHDASNKDKSDVENFARKIETLCETFKESKMRKGFYWDYYVPYFIEMSNKKHIETFSYICHISTGDEKTLAWLKDHKQEVDNFTNWSKNFLWSRR